MTNFVVGKSTTFVGEAYVGPSSSPDITLALSGQAATASAGTLGVAFGLTASGQEATSFTGTLAPGYGLPLSGTAATGATGTLALGLSKALSGHAATGSAGTLVFGASIALLGEAATASAGTIVYSEVEGAIETGGGIGPIEGPYHKPRKEDIDRLKRLMNFTAAEAKDFIARKPEQARLALAVFELSADPDALIDAVLGQPEALDARIRLQTAADAEAVRKIREWIEDENLTLLLILAGSEW